MTLGWFNAREATELGTALADHFATNSVAGPISHKGKSGTRDQGRAWQDFLQRAEREMRALRLNFYKKAQFANSFKWRLLEKGIERQLADEVTHTLVMRLSLNRKGSVAVPDIAATQPTRPAASKLNELLAQADQCVAQGAWADAVTLYERALQLKPRNADAHNSLGAALCRLGRYAEAETHLRESMRIKPNFADPHTNLGNVLRVTGRFEEGESALRRALKLRPADEIARSSLGMLLLSTGRLRDARLHFEKVVKIAPRNYDALFGLAQIAAMEGRFTEADTLFKRLLNENPDMPGPLASMAGYRKMTSADSAWRERVERIVSGGIETVAEINLRFALGKYYDDVRDYDSAFKNFARGNELMKSMVRPYNREAHEGFVEDLIRVYSRETVSCIGAGASDSKLPVLVVGMPRSGTSLMEQIIASHPKAHGAGELTFWTGFVRDHEAEIRRSSLSDSAREQAANEYLRELTGYSAEALRIVDKAPANTEYLGIIHSVFPRARIIHMQRDPIDTCLSCYFQHFSSALAFALDLGDLAHYYRQFHRFMAHWRSVLPAGTILDVPYEELVTDQEKWTRRILEFLELDWDECCLQFHDTKRAVATASTWQVRQKMHQGSVQRWRKYSKYLGPLRELEKLGA
jgi:tetratricopeptide (TPR) repeat protein